MSDFGINCQRLIYRRLNDLYKKVDEQGPTKADLRAELAEAVRNTAVLPIPSDGLPHNAGEGEAG